MLQQSLLQKELCYSSIDSSLPPSQPFPGPGGGGGGVPALSPPAPLYPPLQPSLHFHHPSLHPNNYPPGNYPHPANYLAVYPGYPWVMAAHPHQAHQAQMMSLQYPMSPPDPESMKKQFYSLIPNVGYLPAGGGVMINGEMMRLENSLSVTSSSEKSESATILVKSPCTTTTTTSTTSLPPPSSSSSSSSIVATPSLPQLGPSPSSTAPNTNTSTNTSTLPGNKTEIKPAQKLEVSEISKRIRKEIPKSGVSYFCEWRGCQVQFMSLSALRFHVEEIHVGRRKSYYVCEWSSCCENELTFFKRYEAIMHIRSHIGTRPFGCPFPHCNRWFTRADALLVHERSAHGGQSPRYCDVPGCNAMFTSHIDLKRHRKSVHKLYYVFG